eukprot:scaffold19898_cov34-Tisochrysis_lutea.AAC.2
MARAFGAWHTVHSLPVRGESCAIAMRSPGQWVREAWVTRVSHQRCFWAQSMSQGQNLRPAKGKVLTMSGLHVAIHCIVANVELAPRKPAIMRWAALIEHVREGSRPFKVSPCHLRTSTSGLSPIESILWRQNLFDG